MMRHLFFTLFLVFLFTAVQAQYQNISINTLNNPNEPAICINPKNLNEVIAGANIEAVYISQDGGYTWNYNQLTSSFGVWGDPCLVIDTAGDYYFFHLSDPPGPAWVDRIVCQKSTDKGLTWSDGTYLFVNGMKIQDKEWVAVDPTDNSLYACWTQFDEYGSSNPLDSTIILFTKSTDGGLTWASVKRLNKVAGDCLDDDNTVEGAVPAVGPNGEVYVAWAGPAGIVFNRSLDKGETWLSNNIFVDSMPGGWAYMIPGIYRANGMPVTCCDLSNGPYHGTLYINWSDQRNGTDDTDVWLKKSTDGGTTWSDIKRVNDDPPGRQQFFTWMTIDQVSGYLYIVFYDRRNFTTALTDVYLAVSTDGGETFENIKISESPFLPTANIFFGDYTNITAHNHIVRPIWTRLHNGQLSVFTAIIDSLYTGTGESFTSAIPFNLEQNYPNPFSDDTYFSFKIEERSAVTIKVTDAFGRAVAMLFENKMLSPGKHIEHLDARQYQLSPGTYVISMTCNKKSLHRKMLVAE